MTASSAVTSGAAGRYATALFEIAVEADRVEAVEADLDAISAALEISPDLAEVIRSPLLSRAQQGGVMAALAQKMGLGTEVAGTLGVMAQKRRLPELPAMIAAVKALAADRRGEISAEVTAAVALSAAQAEALSAALREALGREVKTNVTVDAELIGGLVVKVGSQMIDMSVRAKLASLENAMKEVG